MSLRRLALTVLLGAAACSSKPSTHARARPDASAAQPVAAGPVVHHGIPWYEDQASLALAAAKSQRKLLLVDLWAPWCHTCLSMREYVLTEANLARSRERLLFLAINTERAENAALLSALPVGAWPTFYVIDSDQRVYGRWVGAASPAQLATFLQDALKAYDARGSDALPQDTPAALLVAADRLLAKDHPADARELYRRALAVAPRDWPRRPDALVAFASTLRKLGQVKPCVALGLTSLQQTGQSASATDFSYHVLDCAKQLPAGDAKARALRARVERRLSALCDSGSPELTPDDRGDACGLLREVREQLGDEAGAREALTTRLEILQAAAEGLPDRLALTYDFARVESLLGLGRRDEAIALLTAREAALPDDYNPPHYLARAYRELKRYDEALAALERALRKAEGPRRAGMLGLKVDLLLSANQKPRAREVLEQQLAAYRALPAGLKQPEREAKVAERLKAWR
ncbi:MAG TPA: tetratricopeptide repeat protein [Polyangiales bacterium]